MQWARLLSTGLVTGLVTGIVTVCLAGCAGRGPAGVLPAPVAAAALPAPVAAAARPARAASPRDERGTLQFGGLTRTYGVHVPAGRVAGLVLNLHGAGGTGIAQQRLSGFDAVADLYNLLVVYPDGYDKSWADGRGASPADRNDVDDVGFLVRLVGKLAREFGVPRGHVFATGMSNGGFMSNKLACDRADVFAAIAPVSGTLGVGVACRPSQPVSVLEAHGTADPLVPFNGGKIHGRGGLSRSIAALSMVTTWRTADKCHGEPSADVLPNVGDGTVVHRFVSAACAASSEVVFYQIDNGGHTWPGGGQYLPKAIIGSTTRALDASAAMALFFLAHARA